MHGLYRPVLSCYVSVGILEIIKRLLCTIVHVAPLPFEVGDADNDEKINQQNVMSFSVTGIIQELTSLRVVRCPVSKLAVRELSSVH